MQYSTIFPAAIAMLMATQVAAQGQLNFYYDTNCQNYAGSKYNIAPDTVVGGPAGSKAVLWVIGARGDNPCCGGTNYACKNTQCSNSASRDAVAIGQCKSFTNGVWGQYHCNGGCE